MTRTERRSHSSGFNWLFHAVTWRWSESSAARAAAAALAMTSGFIRRVKAVRSAELHCFWAMTESRNAMLAARIAFCRSRCSGFSPAVAMRASAAGKRAR